MTVVVPVIVLAEAPDNVRIAVPCLVIPAEPVMTLLMVKLAGVQIIPSFAPNPRAVVELIPVFPVRASTLLAPMVVVKAEVATAPLDPKTRELIVTLEVGATLLVNFTFVFAVLTEAVAYSPLKPAPFKRRRPFVFPTL